LQAQIPTAFLSEVHHPTPTTDAQLSSRTPPPQFLTSQSATDQANLLAACNLDIAALNKANGLREAIAQVKSGEVQAIRDKYCPKSRKEPSNPVWNSIKNAISRRERLYLQLNAQFGGDEDWFFTFFTLTPDQLQSKKKQKKGENLRGMRKLVEAITRMEKDIAAQKQHPKYLGPDGQISAALWQAVWGNQNDWEVWRQLGLETYN
jgi:hypothetical protein